MKLFRLEYRSRQKQKFNRYALLLATLVLLYFASSPITQAVNPAPDGGYPNGNTAEGDSALAGLTTDFYNSAVGFLSLLSNGTASFNTGVGAGTLLVNTADQNTATGAGALLSNTTGGTNTANGAFALFNNTTGADDTAVGDGALFSNTTGGSNTANGAFALFNNTTGLATAIGKGALFNNTTGSHNTANGLNALFSNTTGSGNTATGDGALYGNTTGSANVANGYFALVSNTIANFNTATGISALENNTGGNNTADGADALLNNTIGQDNTADGADALVNNTTGNTNVALGFDAGGNVTTANSVICIGSFVPGANVDNSCFIGQIRGVTTQNADAIPVLIDSAGQLGTASSSTRFKKEIKPMDKASEAILALKPVTFQYKTDKTSTPQFGLIAEQVAEVNPNLIVRDKDGEIYTVRYDAVNAMLLNEFLKEHRKNEQQRKDFEATIARLQKQVEALTAGLQKVSAQLEGSRSAPQVADSNY